MDVGGHRALVKEVMRVIRIEKSVVIGAPLDKVYAFAMDWRNLTRYFEYIYEVKPITEETVGEGD